MEARAPALYPFTEEFLHTLDSEDATSVAKDVLHRWRADGQRFPPQPYVAQKSRVERVRSTPSGGRPAQQNVWRYVVFLSQL